MPNEQIIKEAGICKCGGTFYIAPGGSPEYYPDTLFCNNCSNTKSTAIIGARLAAKEYIQKAKQIKIKLNDWPTT